MCGKDLPIWRLRDWIYGSLGDFDEITRTMRYVVVKKDQKQLLYHFVLMSMSVDSLISHTPQINSLGLENEKMVR